MLDERALRRVIKDIVPMVDVDKLAVDATFESSGLDSLDHAAILLALQECYQLVVPDEHLGHTNSIRRILDYAAKHRTDR